MMGPHDFLQESEDDDEISETLEDDDICTTEFAKNFKYKYIIADESAVSLKNDYILSLCQDSAFSRVAVGLSNASAQIFDINEQRSLRHAKISDIPPPPAMVERQDLSVCGVRFLDETPNCLLVGTTNGIVRLYDLRTSSQTSTRFEIEAEEPYAIENICCFDRNANGRIICVGTELHRNDVHLIFFDVRERKQMGGYFESHEEDVTTVRFHSTNPDLLCSGSVDGLINVFDIKESNEDDALQLTINTESSVHKLDWHKNVYEKDIISCVTHTNDFKAYDVEEGTLVADFSREKITNIMNRKNSANCNLVTAHNTEDDGIILLAGSYSKKGEIMRSLQLRGRNLLPLANFEGNKQIVRESLYDPVSKSIITGGESGILSLWTLISLTDITTANTVANKLKTKVKLKAKHMPY